MTGPSAAEKVDPLTGMQAIVCAQHADEAGRALAAALVACGAQASMVALDVGPGALVIATAGDVSLLPAVGTHLDASWARLRQPREATWIDGKIAAPIGTSGVVIAIAAEPPLPEAMRVVTALAAAGRVALEHLDAIEEARGLATRQQALLSLQRSLAGGLLEDVFGSFAARLAQEVRFEQAWVGALDSTLGDRRVGQVPEVVEVLAAWSVSEPAPKVGARLPLGDTPVAELLRTGKARRAGPSLVATPEGAAQLASWATSAVIVPLVVHDALVGVLVLLGREQAGAPRGSGRGTSPDESSPQGRLDRRLDRPLDARWLLGAIAEPLAMAAQNAVLFEGLRLTTREWERTFDAMDALVFTADASGNLRRANWALGRRLNVSPSALVGRPMNSLFPGQELPALRPMTGATSPGPLLRANIVGPRGESLRASASALPDGGLVMVLTDVQIAGAQPNPSYSALRRVSTPQPVLARGKVLVVDDEPSILRAVSRTIGRTHDVAIAGDGDEALELLRQNAYAFDAILTDVQMARVGGIDLYHAVEREKPTLAERFVFMTGGVFPNEVEHFLRGLGARVLRKPFDPEVLRRAIESRIALSRVA